MSSHLQSVGMENAGQRLIEFVKFVQLLAAANVPKNSIYK